MYFFFIKFQILDACAAPGSKTVQLIELLHGEESLGIPGNSYYVCYSYFVIWCKMCYLQILSVIIIIRLRLVADIMGAPIG